MKSRYVLIIGPTRHQGGAVAEALLNGGHTVRILTNNPGSESAVRLGHMGAEMAEGDYDNLTSLIKAISGVDAIFCVTNPERGLQMEVKHGKNIIDAATNASVQHIVYSSIANADKGTKVPGFESKFEVEMHIKGSGIPYTIIAPSYFMENLLFNWNSKDLKKGVLRLPIFPNKKIKLISISDVGKFAAMAIEERKHFVGKRIDLAADDLTPMEMALFLTTAMGTNIYYLEKPLSELSSSEPVAMFEWMNKVGFDVDFKGLRKKYQEMEWITFDRWAFQQNWRSLLTQESSWTI